MRPALVIVVELEAPVRVHIDASHLGGTCRAAAWAAGQRQAIDDAIDQALRIASEHCEAEIREAA